MNPVLAFTIIMLIWTVSDYISKKTKSLLSSLFVASIIFLVGFKTNLLPEDLLTSSSLLALGSTIVGFIIVHLGTMISLEDFKKQWKTFVIGVSAILGIVAFLFVFGPLFESTNYIIAAISGISGGTVSIIMVQEVAVAAGLLSVAVLPVLISAFQGIVGFPLTSVILRKEALRLKEEYQSGNLIKADNKNQQEEKIESSIFPDFLQTTSGILCVVGGIVLLSTWLSNLTNGLLNTFVIALILGIILKSLKVIKPNVLNGIDAYGLMMLGVLIIIFGPLASISVQDLIDLIIPLTLSFLIGIFGAIVFAMLAGRLMKYSLPMAIAIGLTSLYGFPGTVILSQEAAQAVGENEDEVKVIEDNILPSMIVAGFSTVTITSVIITSILVTFIS